MFLFCQLGGRALGAESNAFPIGCGTCANVGRPVSPFFEICLPRSLLFFGALTELELESGSGDVDFASLLAVGMKFHSFWSLVMGSSARLF